MMTLLVKTKHNNYFQCSFLADNKDNFRRYRGIEILIDMLKEQKSGVVAKALAHVISGNGKLTQYVYSQLNF